MISRLYLAYRYEPKSIQRMKRAIFTLATVIALFYLAIQFSGVRILKWITDIDYTFYAEQAKSRIYVHNDLELDFYELNSIKSLIELSIIQVDSLLPNDIDKVNVYLHSGANSAVTTPEFSKIVLFNSEDCYAPFCHEYIHAVLGPHKELWFTEGMATFLGQYMRSKNQRLQQYCDGDERYLIGERKLADGPLQLGPNLQLKYEYNSIKELVFNTDAFDELSDENRLDYYFFSTSFFKYLFDTFGESEIIDMILDMKDSHNSISELFNEKHLVMDDLIDAWLVNYKE